MARTRLCAVTVQDKANVLDVLLEDSRAKGKVAELLGIPLEHAARFGDEDMVWKLLAGGASANTQCANGDFVLHLAVTSSNQNSVLALLEHGAHVNAVGEKGHTALGLAAMDNDPRILDVLIAAGADVNLRNHEGDTVPLDLAAIFGSVAVIELLLQNGADLSAVNILGLTALHNAAARGQIGSIKELLRHRADINQKDTVGQTPLIFATRMQQTAAVRALCDLGADPNMGDALGIAPLHVGITQPDFHAAHALLEAGVDLNLNVADADGRTPLHYAARALMVEPARVLVNSGACVNATDEFGQSALHLAASVSVNDSSAYVIDHLLRWGAEEEAVDKNDKTPADVLGLNTRLANGVQVQDLSIDIRARRLLVNADADRRWRRRCFPVMWRARLDRARAEANLEEYADKESRQARDTGPRKKTKVARREGEGGEAGDNGGGGSAHGGAAERASVADADVEGAVANLAGMANSDVFKDVVLFL